MSTRDIPEPVCTLISSYELTNVSLDT